MDYLNQSDLRRSSAKALLTCPLCSQYFDDPRLLPCGDTFCRRCLQKYFDQKQAGSTLRLGRMTCPKCKTMIGIPKSGIEAFPVDTKVNRIKDRVIDELAEKISRNISSPGHSDTQSTHSDRTDFSDTSEDASSKRSNFSSQSKSRFSRGDGASDSSEKVSGSSFAGNPLYPNMAKYAKYFVKDEDVSSTEAPRFKPTIRGERHRVGYSSSFQHRRRRINVDPPKGFDDAADLLRHSRYGSAPHVGRECSSNASSSYSDIFENIPQSSEELGGSRNSSSRSAADYGTSRDNLSGSSRFSSDNLGSATASMPSLSRTRRENDATVNPGTAYSSMRNTYSEPKFEHSRGSRTSSFEEHDNKSTSDETSQQPRNRERIYETNGRSSPLDDRAQGGQHTSFRSHNCSNEKPKSSLPTHRENIVTPNQENEGAFPKAKLREEIHSRMRSTPRPHSDYYSDKTTFSHGESKPSFTHSETKASFSYGESKPSFTHSESKPSFSYGESKPSFTRSESKPSFSHGESKPSFTHSETKTSFSRGESFPETYSHKTEANNFRSSERTFLPRSPLLARARQKMSTTQSDTKSSECRNEEYHHHMAFDRENVTGWDNEPTKSKKRDENIFRTKPDDGTADSKSFLKPEIPKFHKSASFSSNSWQERLSPNDIRNGNVNYSQWTRRGNGRRTFLRTSASSQNLSQFDFPIKFELKSPRNSTEGVNNVNENGNHELNTEDELSETEQRNAFNERILNMKMHKERFENIMYDFKNGNLCSDVNLNYEEPDIVPDETTTETEITLEVSAEEVEKVGSPHEEPGESEKSNSEADSNTTPKPEKVVEEVGRNLKEMIETMRAKYQAQDVVENGSSTEQSNTLQPSCCDSVVPKWNFQKTDFGIPSAIAITSKGCTVVADFGNSCLEFFDSDGNYEHNIEGIKPFSIIINGHDQIVVGDRKGKAIRIFDEFGGDVAQWEGVLFGWISGIALLNNGNVVVYDRDRCKVGIYSWGGENIREFASYGMSDSQLCMADFLTVDAKNRIIVADSGNHCLKIFDTDGNFISKVASRGTTDGFLLWPKGVCVDSMDNILVADSHNNRVSMFSPCGKFVEHLVTTTPSPYSICYSTQSKLLGVTHYALTGFSQYDVYQCLQ